MNRPALSSTLVGNDLTVQARRLQLSTANPIMDVPAPERPFAQPSSVATSSFDYSKLKPLAIIALVIITIVALVLSPFAQYATSRLSSSATTPVSPKQPVLPAPTQPHSRVIFGHQVAAVSEELRTQVISVTIHDKVAQPSPEELAKWFTSTPHSKDPNATQVSVNPVAVHAYVDQLVRDNTAAPIDQVTVTHDDTGTTKQIVSGVAGKKLADPSGVQAATDYIVANFLKANGLQYSLMLQEVPFQALTAPTFDKLLEVDLSTKRTYAYEKGTIVKTFLVSAGAPETPTVKGQFKIFSKLAKQDMRGFNADGSRYFQPNVQWVNYFHKDYAVHGNYWRPTSWFGNANSSHGCVSMPNSEAKWIFDWAPVGTTVIVHE